MEDQPKLIQGGKFVDARGILNFVNEFDFAGVKRFYQASNHEKNFVRAWQGHAKEGKYIYVATGSALVGAVKLNHECLDGIHATTDTRTIRESPLAFTLSSKEPAILWIPPGYANGWKNLEDGTIMLFFSTATLAESKTDDFRFAPNHWDIWSSR